MDIASSPVSDNTEINRTSIIVRTPKLDKLSRAYGTGRRKTSVARVWIKRGTGNFIVNNKPLQDYFGRDYYKSFAQTPLKNTNSVKDFDVMCTAKGGGLTGQMGAIVMGISRALVNYNPELYHKTLKSDGLLTRDARMVHSKRYGRKKARKSFQFSKR